MPEWSNPYEIEYHRVHAGDGRSHDYTERVDDQSFCRRYRGKKQEAYLVYYTRACADDFLRRQREHGSEWIVAVYRMRPERTLLCSVRMRYRPAEHAGP